MNTTRDEAVAQSLSTQEELAYCKSDNFKKNIINDFKSSSKYGSEMSKEASSYLDKGCFHIIHQLHHHFMDKSILLKAFEANFDNEACRQGTDFIPYMTEDIEALREEMRAKTFNFGFLLLSTIQHSGSSSMNMLVQESL